MASFMIFSKPVRKNSATIVHRQRRRRLGFEPLECRRLLTTFTVTNLGDATVSGPGDAPGTLRQAIYDANVSGDPDTIQFAPGLNGDLRLSIASDSAIGLSALLITSPITIQGNSAGITIKRDVTAPNMRFFRVALGGDLTIDSLNITTGLAIGNNGAPGQNGGTAYAGAIYNQGNLHITNSTLFNNSTVGGDAGAGGNSGAAHGGAIFSDGGNVTITNSTLSGNSAVNGTGPMVARSYGGNLYMKNGVLDIYNSTLTSGAALSGRDLYVIGLGAGQTATVHLYSSIFAQADITLGAFDVNVTDDLGGQVVASGENNIMRWHNVPASMVATSEDPLLGPLANNGGPTLTHALQPLSPAINQGSNPESLVNDERGASFARTVGGRADIGAFEVQTVASPDLPGDYNRDNSVDARDYVFWRKSLGTSVAQFSAADGNGNSTVDAGDYDVWRGHFGAPPAGGSIVESAVSVAAPPVAADDYPEPLADDPSSSAFVASYYAPPVARRFTNSKLARAPQSQSPINLEANDLALLAITSSGHVELSWFSPTSNRVHPNRKDPVAASQTFTTALTQSPLRTLPCAAASTGTA